jgi:hypothetical protein
MSWFHTPSSLSIYLKYLRMSQMKKEMLQNSISEKSTCCGIASSSQIITGRSSGVRKRTVTTSLKRMTLLRKISFNVSVATAFVSNVWKKSINQLIANKLRSGTKKKSLIQKILLGLKPTVSLVLSASQTSRRTKVACI